MYFMHDILLNSKLMTIFSSSKDHF